MLSNTTFDYFSRSIGKIVKSKTRKEHPPKTGKIERFPQSLRSECIRVPALEDYQKLRSDLSISHEVSSDTPNRHYIVQFKVESPSV